MATIRPAGWISSNRCRNALRLATLSASVWLAVAAARAEAVLITELMYRPASEDPREEFVELYNPGTNAISLKGWRFSTGVRFTFPDVSLPPGGYLAVAASLANFATNHPGVANVVGDWEGILSNSGQLLELVDAAGARVDAVRYADEGDWAVRQRAAADYGHRGLEWTTPADGGGRSLELVNLGLPNRRGQNWASSLTPNGTPGRPNSVAAADLAPLILDVAHFPAIPSSTQAVTVTARILDELPGGLTVVLHHRPDGTEAFASLAMADDGQHGDGAAGDGVFGAQIPAHPNNTVMEFYVEARDAGGQARTYPAAVSEDGLPAQVANLLYQVDDTLAPAAMPTYRLIMRAQDVAELRQINRNTPAAPFPQPAPYTDQTRSHAQMNGTFISVDGAGTEVRYLVNVRNRGNGSRSRQPQSYRIGFRSDDLWKGVSAINLNSQYPQAQLFGSALYQRAGLATQQSRAVQVRVNNVNPASSGTPSYGFYACNEVLNSEFAASAFPQDSSGNLYRGIRLAGNGADLHYEGELPAPYRLNYFKQTNTSEDDWSDLVELTRVLDTEPDATYAEAVRRVVNVEAWMLYFALETLVDNRETDLANGNNGTGEGDDYFLYRGVADRRFRVLPYDLDTILGQGDSSFNVNDPLFRMNANPVVARLMQHPEFAPIYYATLVRLADSVFTPATFDPLVDQTLGGLVPSAVMAAMKQFAADRRAGVLAQIPLELSVTNLPAASNGYPHTTNATVSLGGHAHAVSTRAVRVAGQPATWTAWTGSWTAPAVSLRPGINRILIQSLDAAGAETAREVVEIWSDRETPVAKSGTITTAQIWPAGNSPYLVDADLTIAAGGSLTIEAGATVFLAGGADVRVDSGGVLKIAGADTAPVVLTRQPGGASWGGLLVNGRADLSFVHFDGNGSVAIHGSGGDLTLDHLTFGNAGVAYLSLDGCSFEVSHCHFPTPTAAFEPLHGTGGIKAGGRGILRDSFIGAPNGYNDAFDFTGGQRPSPILHVVNNVFAGSGDDLLDLDGTDSWIEGNVFLHCHKNGAPDSSSAVSGGSNGGQVSRITVLNNLIFDCDHAVTAKQGNFYTVLNNTIVHTTRSGGVDIESGVVNLQDAIPAPPTTYGDGCLVAGNVIVDAEALTRNYDPAESRVTFTNNWLPQPWLGPGGGNRVGSPKLRHLPALDETRFTSFAAAQVLREWFSLAEASADVGFQARGARIQGVPAGTTRERGATLHVGPAFSADLPWASGYTEYRWRLDGGEWSAAAPASAPILLSELADGPHFVEVVARDDGGLWQDDPGLAEQPAISRSATWVVDTQRSRLLLNEILARNRSYPVNDAFPDLVELFNDSAAPLDLAGVGLTTDPAEPYAFKFPAGATIPAGGYLVVQADNQTNAPGFHLGFALKQSGESVHLFDRAERGGQRLDSVTFGPQVDDFSIGRIGETWALNVPTFGAANQIAATGDPAALRLNEWLAAPRAVFRDDFVEIYNPEPSPVALGGLFLTDNPVGWPARQAVPPLSFIAAQGYLAFSADGNPDQGADHLAFSLAAEQGVIALLDGALDPIDWVVYGPQMPDVSNGRSPNGANSLAFFSLPSPGSGNPGGSIQTNVTTELLSLVALTNTWRYHQTGALADGWQAEAYADGSWPESRAVFWVDPDSLAVPTNTPLTLGQNAYYFRTHFQFPTNTAGFELQARTVVDDGLVAYLNGVPLFRENMPAGSVTAATYATVTVDDAAVGPWTTIPAGALREGDNVLAVEVHQANSGSKDLAFGLALQAVRSITNSTAIGVPVLLSEVAAAGHPLTNASLAETDWIELYNPTTAPVDLADCSLSDDPAAPRKWVFGPGTLVPAQGFLVIQCNSAAPVSSTNTGFSLQAQGGAVLFADRPAHGGGLLDALYYGLQVAGHSLGRNAEGWQLALPTPGAANLAAALGNASFVRINEWMAQPVSGDDWFELYNPNAQPVELGGLFLSDDLNNRTLSVIPPLSFLAPGGFQVFLADGSPGKGADHANFKLSAGGEAIGLFWPDGGLIDGLTFGAQALGVSEGRSTDGGPDIARFPGRATPGFSNVPAGILDSDHDGLPDDWERSFGLNPFDPADAFADADHDGLTNAQEFAAGTRPDDAGSALAVRWNPQAAGGSLQFDGVAGHSYSLLVADSLEGGEWRRLRDFSPLASDSVLTVDVPEEVGAPQRFFRLVTPARP